MVDERDARPAAMCHVSTVETVRSGLGALEVGSFFSKRRRYVKMRLLSLVSRCFSRFCFFLTDFQVRLCIPS